MSVVDVTVFQGHLSCSMLHAVWNSAGTCKRPANIHKHNVSVHAYMRMHVCMCVQCMYVHMCSVRVYVYIYILIHLHISIYIYVYINMYIYNMICVHPPTLGWRVGHCWEV